MKTLHYAGAMSSPNLNSGSNQKHILVCDDDPLFRKTLALLLRDYGTVTSVQNTAEALELFRTKTFDLVLLDIQMRTPEEGLDALPKIRAIDADLSIIMLSGLRDFEVVRRAMKGGADDYLVKDFEPEEFKITVERALGRRQLEQTSQKRNSEVTRNSKRYRLVGESQNIHQLRKHIEKFRTSNANVLIQGETGTGKEIVAHLLRKADERGNLEPFVAIDSATLHAQTAESMLFGHEKGAFTGAEIARKGLFEEADGGAIFFDEIANMPLMIQAKLLRVLQEKEIMRMGSNRSIPLEFRVIAATNRSLDAMVTRGEFLPDLIQRLNILPLTLSPLRERKEDLPLLVNFFLAEKTGGLVKMAEAALDAISNYSWPGNVRELSALIDYSLAITDDSEIDIADLHPKIIDTVQTKPSAGLGFYEEVSKFEAELLRKAYEKLDGNVSQIALQLGIDRSHLHTKLKLHGIHQAKGRS